MKICFLLIGGLLTTIANAQLMQSKDKFTHADTLRGSITEYRQGWDVKRYDLHVKVDIPNKSISGFNTITFNEEKPVTTMQVDLQEPLIIDSIRGGDGNNLSFKKLGNAWLVNLNNTTKPAERSITVYYHGTPKEALNAPWDGGVVWSKDNSKNPFIGTACQGLGASVWWPCKDHQSDEPDNGMSITLTAPDTLSAISNGRLANVTAAADGNKTWTWQVKNPINTYAVTMNIGKYSNWKDTLQGEGGTLDISYWPLTENLQKAKNQFKQTKPMLQCFEHWFGKYPFYEDSYKLVETPFLGMEHQSAVAYGNKYKNGYLGNDISGSGWGNKWDFIIVHESGHEWFGNNVTTNDIADMWVHEGFTSYSEVLYTECQSGKTAAYDYARGVQKNIRNDRPLIGPYGVNKEGSGDMYPKGTAIIHTIRNMMNNDERFRMLLRKLQSTFYHKTVTTTDIEELFIKETGLPLEKFFNQYLRTTKVPVLEYSFDKKNNEMHYRLVNTIDGLKMPLTYQYKKINRTIDASSDWKKMKLPKDELAYWNPELFERNYYIKAIHVQK